MERFGIDISKWQGKDFDIKSTGAEFVIVKAGGSDDGLYIDSQFLNNYSNAKNLGLDVGCYWYTKAADVEALKEEILYLTSKIKGLQFELPIYLDIEENDIYFYSNELAVTWIQELLKNGYYPGIYSGYYWFYDQLTDPIIADYPIWLAFWTDAKPNFKWKYGIWQYGHLKAINSIEVDCNRQYIDYSFIKERGYNGFKKITFSDVDATNPDYKSIMWAANNGLVKGYKDGTFKPDEPLTRGQLCTILWREAGKP